MSNLQSVRGTHDLLPDDSRRHRHVEETAFAIARRYGFGEIVTPIFEFTEVFARTLGETSDVVTKEMYCFTDRSGDSLTSAAGGHGRCGARLHFRRFGATIAAEAFLPRTDVSL